MKQPETRRHYTIPGIAIPSPRPRVTRQGVYYPEAYVEWRAVAQVALLEHGRLLWEGPVWLEVVFYGARANADIDNLLKVVMDCGTGILWVDDKQIERVRMEKVPVINPRDRRTEIEAGPLL